MTMDRFLIFGLGNPEKKYLNSRHNIGRQVIDFIAEKQKCQFQQEKKFKSLICETTITEKRVILAKSTIFMNESGLSVRLIKDYYKINVSNIWIIHDDVDIAFAKIKISRGKGAAGHHGVESVIQHLATDQFYRLRIGIWHLPFEIKSKEITPSYVMDNFTSEERLMLREIKVKAVSQLETALISFADPTYER